MTVCYGSYYNKDDISLLGNAEWTFSVDNNKFLSGQMRSPSLQTPCQLWREVACSLQVHIRCYCGTDSFCTGVLTSYLYVRLYLPRCLGAYLLLHITLKTNNALCLFSNSY